MGPLTRSKIILLSTLTVLIAPFTYAMSLKIEYPLYDEERASYQVYDLESPQRKLTVTPDQHDLLALLIQAGGSPLSANQIVRQLKSPVTVDELVEMAQEMNHNARLDLDSEIIAVLHSEDGFVLSQGDDDLNRIPGVRDLAKPAEAILLIEGPTEFKYHNVVFQVEPQFVELIRYLNRTGLETPYTLTHLSGRLLLKPDEILTYARHINRLTMSGVGVPLIEIQEDDSLRIRRIEFTSEDSFRHRIDIPFYPFTLSPKAAAVYHALKNKTNFDLPVSQVRYEMAADHHLGMPFSDIKDALTEINLVWAFHFGEPWVEVAQFQSSDWSRYFYWRQNRWVISRNQAEVCSLTFLDPLPEPELRSSMSVAPDTPPPSLLQRLAIQFQDLKVKVMQLLRNPLR